MNRNYVGIISKILAVPVLIRIFMIPNTSSMTIGFILQSALFIPIAIYALLFDKFSKKIRIIIGAGFLIPLIFTGFLAIYGNSGTVTFDEDVIIVLGAGTNVAGASSPLARRLNTAVYVFERNPDAYVIVCGGLGIGAAITEAYAMANHLYSRGIPREQILLEYSSTSTIENLTFANEILNNHFPYGFRAVVVSNDFHMFRAVSIARSVGMYANHMGASTPTRLLTENYLREMLAILNFWIFE